jgi:hypothetical protein
MRLEEWFNFYSQIISEFGYSQQEDEEAARLMHSLAKGKLLDAEVLKNLIHGRSVAVIGGGIQKSEFEEVKEDLIITAGKAILRVENKLKPAIHVTDMEEPDELLVRLEKEGCVLVLHAHGDNVERIRSVVPKLCKFVATTQSQPFDRVYNFGGFTDGDRAAIMAKEMGAARIKLYGFRFGSGGRVDNVKARKLKWAEKLLRHEGLL